MSVQAISWALDDAPDVPSHLVAVLIGLANHADEHGRGAYPSQARLARYTRKDTRAVRRDLEQLVGLGLISRGDQRYVAHLPPDRRPVVYDLALDQHRPPTPDPARRGRPARPAAGAEKRADAQTLSIPDGKREGLQTRPDVDDKTGGSTGPKRGGPHALQTVPRTVQEPPPPARAEPAAAAGDLVEGEGAEPLPDPDPDPPPADAGDPGTGTLTAAPLDGLVAELVAAQPGWSPPAVRRALVEAAGQGRAPDVVAAAARSLARGDHGPTYSPGRLLADGPWWAAAGTGPVRVEQIGPHPYTEGPHGMCATCCRPEGARTSGRRAHPRRPTPAAGPAPAARCAHGRRPGVCLDCRPRAARPPAQRRPADPDGMAALAEAVAELGTGALPEPVGASASA